MDFKNKQKKMTRMIRHSPELREEIKTSNSNTIKKIKKEKINSMIMITVVQKLIFMMIKTMLIIMIMMMKITIIIIIILIILMMNMIMPDNRNKQMNKKKNFKKNLKKKFRALNKISNYNNIRKMI